MIIVKETTAKRSTNIIYLNKRKDIQIQNVACKFYVKHH